MSSIANLGAASAALPQLNVHPHGHKKGGLDALSTDLTSSGSTAQLPVPAAQNLFSNLLQSLEQVIGLGSTPAFPAGAAAPATTGAAPATRSTAASTASAAPSTSAATGNTLLQYYLHNAPQSVQAAAAKLRFNA